MDSNKKSIRRHRETVNTGVILAAFVVFPLSVLILTVLTIPKTYKSLDLYRWQPQPAKLVSVELMEVKSKDSGGVNRYVKAQYRYRWQGDSYTSEQFNIINDNKLTRNRHTYIRLKKAYDEGSLITAWVNPGAPSEAVIDRRFPWGELLLMWIVPTIFCYIGFISLHNMILGDKVPEGGNSPWLANPSWRDNIIQSDARSKMFVYWTITIVLTIIGLLPLSSSGGGDVPHDTRLISAFPFNLLVFASLAAAVTATRQWWRYGASPLRLDPFPGAIGGEVGGEIHFRIPYRQGIRAEVQLSVVREEKSRDGEGFDRTVEWQEDGYASISAKDNGIALQFRFAVPEGLPQSDISYERRRHANHYYNWKLNIVVNNSREKIERSFEIPVYSTGEHSSEIRIDTLQATPFANIDHAVHQLLPIRVNGKEAMINYPLRSFSTAAQAALYFGIALSALGALLLANNSTHNWELYLYSGSSLIIGLGIMGLIISRQLTTLRVRFNGLIISSERLLLGFPLRSDFISYYDIENITHSLAPGAQKGDSYQAERMVYAVTPKGKITLAERIEGRRNAELVIEYLQQLVGLEELNRHTNKAVSRQS